MTQINYKQLIQPALEVVRYILSRKGLKDSNLNKKADVKVTGGQVIILMPSYAEFADAGRKAGRMPPVNDIIKWIRRKNIKVPQGYTQEGFAFAIARKIAKDGTEGKHFLDAIRLRLVNLVADYTSKQLDNEIKKI